MATGRRTSCTTSGWVLWGEEWEQSRMFTREPAPYLGGCRAIGGEHPAPHTGGCWWGWIWACVCVCVCEGASIGVCPASSPTLHPAPSIIPAATSLACCADAERSRAAQPPGGGCRGQAALPAVLQAAPPALECQQPGQGEGQGGGAGARPGGGGTAGRAAAWQAHAVTDMHRRSIAATSCAGSWMCT